MTIPTLQTARLMLRAPKLADFEHWAAFFASDRSRHERGPLDRVDGYRAWAADVALWTLRGYGAFGLDDRATGAYLGEVLCRALPAYWEMNPAQPESVIAARVVDRQGRRIDGLAGRRPRPHGHRRGNGTKDLQ